MAGVPVTSVALPGRPPGIAALPQIQSFPETPLHGTSSPPYQCPLPNHCLFLSGCSILSTFFISSEVSWNPSPCPSPSPAWTAHSVVITRPQAVKQVKSVCSSSRALHSAQTLPVRRLHCVRLALRYLLGPVNCEFPRELRPWNFCPASHSQSIMYRSLPLLLSTFRCH